MESLVVFRNSQMEEARGTIVSLSRSRAVFEVYNPYSIVQLSELLSDFRVQRGDRTIYRGRAVVSNLVSTGLLLMVSATLVDPWSDMAGLSPGPKLRTEVNRFVDDWDRARQRLRPSYELCVSRLRNFLHELSRWLEHGEMEAGIHDVPPDSSLPLEFLGDVAEEASPKLGELFEAFEHEASEVAPEDVDIHKVFCHRDLHPLVMCSPFLHRIFHKPLGYAGDYEMVNMILGDIWEGGSNTYARLVNGGFLSNATAVGHRNRVDRLEQYLVDELARVQTEQRPLRVLNVGCGPAEEMQRFIRKARNQPWVQFDLMDFNQQTLDVTKSKIGDHTSRLHPASSVQYIHKSIHELLKEAVRRTDDSPPQYDFVYCAGLFDYVQKRTCSLLVKLFFEWISPSGVVVVTNVHTSNPVRATMEHLAEWNLILRDERDMMQLAPDLGEQSVWVESAGTNIFLELRKPNSDGDQHASAP